MPTIKEQLQDAFKTAVSNYNAGGDCNEAVVKAAQAHDLNVHQTQRVLEMFNTGKSIHYFEKAGADRTGQFELADPAVVVPALFGKQAVEAAVAPKQAAPVLTDYTFYDSRPRNYKVEYNEIGMEVTASHDFDPNDLIRQASRKIASWKRAADATESAITATNYKYNDELAKLGSAFQNAPHTFAEFERECHEAFGPRCSEFVEHAASRVKGASRMVDTKLAAVSEFGYHNPGIMNIADTAMGLTSTAETLAAERTKLAENIAAAEIQVDMALGIHKEAEWFDSVLDIAPQRQRLRTAEYGMADLLDTSAIDKEAAGGATNFSLADLISGPSSGSGPTMMGQLANDVSGGVSGALKDQVSGSVKGMLGPARSTGLEERLRNLRRQHVLETLMVEDPIIRTADPDAIQQAYMTIMEVSPEVSTQREVVRSMLRQALQSSGVSAYDAKSLAELDNELRKQVSFHQQINSRK
jgi:hypothetical protein